MNNEYNDSPHTERPDEHTPDEQVYPATPPRLPRPTPAPRQKRSGFLTDCVISLLIVGLCGAAAVVLIVAAVMAAGQGSMHAQPLNKQIVEIPVVSHAGVEDKIAIIDVKGLILSNIGYDGADSGMISSQLQLAMQDPHVVGVVLDMDTPGGEITASDEIYTAVQALAAEKPVVACMRSVCASGGYYVAAAADYIIANPLTLTGSIGVVVPHFTYQELLRKVGVELTPYTSGDLKDMLSGGVEREPSLQQFIDDKIQEMVDISFHRFAQVVAEGRDSYESAEDILAAPFKDGRVMLGSQAFDFGLVDELGYLDNAIERAQMEAGVREVNIVRYRRPLRLRDLLMAFSTETGVKIETGLPKEWGYLHAKNLYYLMPDLVQ